MSRVYLALLRGVNVGGKNKLAMAELRVCLEELGCKNVRTYIASGNVIFESDKSAAELTDEIQDILPKKFKLDSELIKILILSREQLQKVIDDAPKGFGAKSGTYHSDAVFPSLRFILSKPRSDLRSVKLVVWTHQHKATALTSRRFSDLKHSSFSNRKPGSRYWLFQK